MKKTSCDKRISIPAFWVGIALTSAFSFIVFPLGEKAFYNSIFLFDFFYPLIHFFLAAFIYEMLSGEESVMRSFYAGLVSFNLFALLLSFFVSGYWLLIVLGLTFFAVTGFLGTSIGFLAAVVLKGNQIRQLP